MILKIYNDVEILIDDEDVERVLKVLSKNCHWYYNQQARNVIGLCNTISGKKVLKLSRVIMNCNDSNLDVDHKFHNQLDYRKSELRVCTHQENCRNQKKQRGTTSKYKGVYWYRRDKIWCAIIKHNRKKIYIGRFKIEDEAGRAYDKKAKELFGEFCKLNFPND